MTTLQAAPVAPANQAWKLNWLTPARCRMILALLLAIDVAGHISYLNNHCPADLSGDEAQYWDWSRNLDWSYYSKGPLVAYIIRGSCWMFGDSMQGVRYPAIAFGVGTSIVTYLLVRRLFGSERLALGTVLLTHVVPLFVGGSVLMTIDPPMFFCWALATYFAAGAIFEGRRWNWILAGLFVGVGFLAKYALMAWFVGLLLYLILYGREQLKAAWPWIAFIVACVPTTPVVAWNVQHGGASIWHVAHQTGATGGKLSHGNFAELIGSQIMVVGPVIAIWMVCGIARAVGKSGVDDPHRRKLQFLVCIGLPFFVFTAIISLFAKAQVNWPAPAYFTLIILAAYFLSTRLASIETWRRWRWWFWGTVVLGMVTIPLAHDSSRLFPIARLFHVNPSNVDVLMRLRGWKSLGHHVTQQLDVLGPNAFILCDDYMQTAEMAFYVRGQPKTYYAGSYYADAKRFTQYDMWPDRRLDQPALLGRDAVYVGKGGGLPKDIASAFDRVEQLPELPVIVEGVTVRTFKTWRCYGFKGMIRAGRKMDY